MKTDTPHAVEKLLLARQVLQLEADAIRELGAALGREFVDAVDRIVACRGMVVVTGMGKAGLIGAKLSATLASTGTPSLSLHPAEALHGDLGRLRADDLLIALSNSGETVEIKALVPAARKIGAGVVAITGNADSTLGRLADCVLAIGRVDEAGPMGLAPTVSTASMLALGDALAMVVLAQRDFSREDYALYHPAGALGRRLLRVSEVMRHGEELPLVASGTRVIDVLLTTSRTPGRPGAALVCDADGRLAGIFTDGDLRRLLEAGQLERLQEPVDRSMATEPKCARPEQLVDEAERTLRRYKIDQLPVVDPDGRPVGLIDIQDVLDIRV